MGKNRWIGGKELMKALGVKSRYTLYKHVRVMLKLGFPIRFMGKRWETTQEAVEEYSKYITRQTKGGGELGYVFDIEKYIEDFTKGGR